VQYIFERTTLVYFFANQIEMLEITNLENTSLPAIPVSLPSGLAAPLIITTPAENFRALVTRWKQMQTNFQTRLHPSDEAARSRVQVVAWSDPSDVITFRVPKIGDVDVVNLYVRNAVRWFGLVESPSKAHGNYARNREVLRVMFLRTAQQPKP
jgi:hypothetical protein